MFAKLSSTFVCLSMLGTLVGCGDDDGGKLYLGALDYSQLPLQVNQTVDVKLRITAAATEKTYIDIENNVPNSVKTNPIDTLALAKGAQQGVVVLTGVAGTAGAGYHTITFKLRGTTSTQDLEVRVNGAAPAADAGPPQPDTNSPQPDATMMSDAVPKNDATKPDTAAAAPDATQG